jgi:hypothetical protein
MYHFHNANVGFELHTFDVGGYLDKGTGFAIHREHLVSPCGQIAGFGFEFAYVELLGDEGL